MSVKVKDLRGQRFGRLTIMVRSDSRPNGRTRWKCRCICGVTVVVAQESLKNGDSRSCGCLRSEVSSDRLRKHGEAARRSPEYVAWQSMLARCYRTASSSYKDYGGRGIKVCKRWRNSFENFLADVGRKPSPKHTLEREDNDSDYCPSNVIWATRKQQASNRRTTCFFTLNGMKKSVGAWADELGVNASALRMRRKRGWSDKKALTTSVKF